MQVTTKAIVLSTLKFGDTSLIVKAFTASDGLKSYVLKGVLAAKKGKVKTAYFLPLSQLELVAFHKNKGTLENIREAKIHYPYKSIHTDVAKNAITFFLAEILANTILEEEPNHELFNYLEYSLQWLDGHEHISNFHLVFLLELTRFLGFYPDTSAMEAPYFNLGEGTFTNTLALHPVIQEGALTRFKQLLGTDYNVMKTIGMSKVQKQELLQIVLMYYELHVHGFRKPKSLAILNEVFS